LLFPLEVITPGDDWRMEVAVPVENPEPPPLYDDEIGTEALDTPGLLYGGGGPADDGDGDAGAEFVYWFGTEMELEGIAWLVGIDCDAEPTGDETGRLELGAGGVPLDELPPP